MKIEEVTASEIQKKEKKKAQKISENLCGFVAPKIVDYHRPTQLPAGEMTKYPAGPSAGSRIAMYDGVVYAPLQTDARRAGSCAAGRALRGLQPLCGLWPLRGLLYDGRAFGRKKN